MKPLLSIEEQIARLIENKNVKVNSQIEKEKFKSYLLKYNYINVIGSTKLLFATGYDIKKKEHIYEKATNFKDIMNLHDKFLKFECILREGILDYESQLKVMLSIYLRDLFDKKQIGFEEFIKSIKSKDNKKIFNNKEETNIYYDFGTNKDIEIDVELIANYPNQLCYDGKSYAITYGLPILTDYTVIADRTWFAEKVDNGIFMSKALEQNGAFILEYKQGDKWNTYSYYSATNVNIDKDNSIVYQTKNKYNEQTIYPGDKQDTDTLFIGTIRKDDSRSFIGCHGNILLFNRSLTEYEISWVKNNMMCSKQQEPDIDL